MSAHDDLHVLRLPISRSIRDALVLGGMLTVRQVRGTNDDVLLRARGIGPASLTIVRAFAPFDAELGKLQTPSAGLKTACGQVAAVFGMDIHRLYETQRTLTMAGLLDQRPGRGPSSGVPYSIENLAILLALFFSESTPLQIAEIATRAREFATQRSR